MSIEALPFDAWASIGHYLSPASLSSVAATCSHVHDRIWSNQTLWSLHAANRWRSCSHWGIVDDWTGLYRAGHVAACRDESPYSAHVLVKHSSSGYRPPPSTISPISSVSSRPCPFLRPPDVVTAALDSRLHFWVWEAPDAAPAGDVEAAASGSEAAGSGASGLSQALQDRAGFARSVSGGAKHYCSHPQSGHTAVIDVLLDVPAVEGCFGVATGSRDTTVKLWAPLQDSCTSQSPSSTVGLVRPVRTLRGHTGSILALAALRGSTAAAGDSSGASFTVLASGSSDTTVKLWDIAKLQQLPPAAAAGAAVSNRHTSLRRSNSTGPAVGRHHGYRSLLATLRGHSGPVTSLLRWDEDSVAGAINSRGTRSSLSSGCGLLSASKDNRVKLWDVAEGRQACVATWRLPGACNGVVDGLYLPGSVVVRMPSALQVLDVRTPGSAGSTTQGVATLSWPSCDLTTAAAHGITIAAGGCRGVHVWDVRMAGDSSSNSSRGGGVRNELFTSRMPNSEPVSLLHMDRLELVAATSTSAVHSPASIAVWSLPCGQRVQLLSSTLSAVTIHGQDTVMSRADLTAARETAWQLLESMSSAGANQVLSLLHQQHLAQLQNQQQAGQQEQDPGGAGNHQQGNAWGDGADEEPSEIASMGDLWLVNEDVEDDSDSDYEDVSGDPTRANSASSSMGTRSSAGRIEPGVTAMAVQGGVIACVDALGNVLVRDFATGTPTAEQVQQFIKAGPAAGADILAQSCKACAEQASPHAA